MTDLLKRLNDGDLEIIMKYEKVKKEDVENVVACIFGENDGPSWHYILKMKDKSYRYLTGSCDYTGWGCQDSSESYSGTLKEVLAKVTTDDYDKKNVREQLKAQIKGKQPYGLQM